MRYGKEWFKLMNRSSWISWT